MTNEKDNFNNEAEMSTVISEADNGEQESFSYSYSAKEQEEIRKIREKYSGAPQKEKSPIDRVREIEEKIHNKATVVSLVLGIVGALVMGTGMSLLMTEIGNLLGSLAMPIGIVAGVIGIALVALAYPAYNKILATERRKNASEVLRLTEMLLK